MCNFVDFEERMKREREGFYCICGKRGGSKAVFTVAAETGCF